jgi:hypothetical protein
MNSNEKITDPRFPTFTNKIIGARLILVSYTVQTIKLKGPMPAPVEFIHTRDKLNKHF